MRRIKILFPPFLSWGGVYTLKTIFKGRSVLGWFLLGIIIFPILLLGILLLPALSLIFTRTEEAKKNISQLDCPYCHNQIKLDTVYCPHCEKNVAPIDVEKDRVG